MRDDKVAEAFIALKRDLDCGQLEDDETWACGGCSKLFGDLTDHDNKNCGPVARCRGPVGPSETPHGGPGLPPGLYYVGVVRPFVFGPYISEIKA